MRSKQLIAFPVLCAVLALAAFGFSACGGGDDDSGSATSGEPPGAAAEGGADSGATEADDDSASGGNAPAPSGDAVRSAKVEIEDFDYDPDPVTIEEGGKVIWQNEDSAPHTATADDGSFDTGTIEQGKIGSETFKQAGTYPYFCEIHPDMRGILEVVEK
jgi:plastocyanin